MRKLLAGICVLATALLCRAEDAATILKRMDASAPALRAMSADMRMVTLTAVIDDKISESGTLKMKKGKGTAVRAVIDFSAQSDSAREIGFFGKSVRIYYPNLHYYQDYDLGKNSNILNQLLLLGFGTSGEELAQSYTISAEGTEKIAGVNATKLLLDPKDPKVKAHLSKIEIWIPDGESSPIQQQFYEPTGNYRLVTYTNVRINPPIKGDLDIQMQSGTQKRDSK